MAQKTKQVPETFDGMAVPPRTNIQGWDTWPINFKKMFLLASKAYTMDRITEVKASIHKVALSGEYIKVQIEELLGGIAWQKNYNPNYRYKYVRNEQGMKWSIYLAPTNSYWPRCLFVGRYPRPRDLDNLLVKLAQLTVKSAEYTLDFMCLDRLHVSDLFNMFIRYLWIPRYTDIRIARIGFINHTLYLGPVKIYERGSDATKKKRKAMHWRPWELDRVRLEFNASYDALFPMGLTSTSALITDPLFEDMLYGAHGLMYRFAKFKDRAQGVPREWEKYDPSRKPRAHLGQGFQEYYLDLVPRHHEPHKKVQPAEGFEDLLRRIHRAVQDFSHDWQQDVNKLGSEEL